MDAGISINVLPSQADFYIPYGAAASPRAQPTLTSTASIACRSTVSLVIPTYLNTSIKKDTLSIVLQGLEGSQSVVEVVLIGDSTSQHGSEGPPADVGEKTLIVHDGIDNNRGASRNLGASVATGEHLLFIDDDMILKDWRTIDVILSRVMEDDYDCALFPRRQYVRFPLLYRREALRETIKEWRAQDSSSSRHIFDPIAEGSFYKTISFCFPGCFMLIKRDCFASLGGFAEDFEGWGLEDADFALRASSSLSVLNLFLRSEPLLHIDHPVSPYKSDEHRTNYRLFAKEYSSLDLDMLCDRVSSGVDFTAATKRSDLDERLFTPLKQISHTYEIPLDSHDVRQNYRLTLEKRVAQGFEALPDHLVLHGSRGRGTSRPGSDYDVLCLFSGGMMREFYVAPDSGLELEYTDRQKFEDVANRPAAYPLAGPLELAKLANGVHLWGDHDEWTLWRSETIETGVAAGWTVWLIMTVGLRLSEERYGALVSYYDRCLHDVFRGVTGSPSRDRGTSALTTREVASRAGAICCILDEEHIDWRERVHQGKKVFPQQVPEIWRALQWLVETKR